MYYLKKHWKCLTIAKFNELYQFFMYMDPQGEFKVTSLVNKNFYFSVKWKVYFIIEKQDIFCTSHTQNQEISLFFNYCFMFIKHE